MVQEPPFAAVVPDGNVVVTAPNEISRGIDARGDEEAVDEDGAGRVGGGGRVVA